MGVRITFALIKIVTESWFVALCPPREHTQSHCRTRQLLPVAWGTKGAPALGACRCLFGGESSASTHTPKPHVCSVSLLSTGRGWGTHSLSPGTFPGSHGLMESLGRQGHRTGAPGDEGWLVRARCGGLRGGALLPPF